MSKKQALILAYSAAGITAAGMADVLRRVTDVPVSAEEQTRVQSILKPLMNMALQDGRAFLAATVASTKGTKEDKPDQVVKVRASEAGTIYGAMKLCGFDVVKMGWNAAVKAARDALKEKGVTAKGDKVLTDVEKAAKAILEVQRNKLPPNINDLPDEAKLKALADAHQAATVAVAESEGRSMARRIVKTHGIAFSRTLLGYIEQVIAEAEQDADNKATVQHPEVADAEEPKRATGKGKRKS